MINVPGIEDSGVDSQQDTAVVRAGGRAVVRSATREIPAIWGDVRGRVSEGVRAVVPVAEARGLARETADARGCPCSASSGASGVGGGLAAIAPAHPAMHARA